jgi:glycosyltransferase involved in cell wall biosynthesis
VWALEPFHGGSHRQFLLGLRRHSQHRFELHTLPGRHWRWRMHGSALELARRSWLGAAARPPQVLFASDMLDVPGYLALAHPEASAAPLMLYFHENQLTYPLPLGQERDLGYGMRNVLSALASDAVYFNSAYHRSAFLAAARELLAAMPDGVPAGLVARVEEKSRVLPVACDLRALDAFRPGAAAGGHGDGAPSGRWGDPADGPLVLWNQRWEYDKAPGDLFSALFALQELGVPFRVALAGAGSAASAALFREARERLGRRVVQWGRLPVFADYARLLWEADVVVSTALHENFGVGVVEAVYCGCRPVLPRRLSYPELLPADARELALYDEGGLVPLLRRAIDEPREWSPDWQRTWVSRFDWGNMSHRYDREVWECWERGSLRALPRL